MRNPITAAREWWVNRHHEPPEPRKIDPPIRKTATVQDTLNAITNRHRDEPLVDICLHDFDGDTLGCHRPATSNRLLCGKHAAQHDRVKRDRARKKRARSQARKARR